MLLLIMVALNCQRLRKAYRTRQLMTMQAHKEKVPVTTRPVSTLGRATGLASRVRDQELGNLIPARQISSIVTLFPIFRSGRVFFRSCQSETDA